MNLLELWKNFSSRNDNKVNEIPFIYDENEINNIKDMLKLSTSPVLSPVIKHNIEIIREYEKEGDTTVLEKLIPKNINISNYMEDLAKAYIFVSKNVDCPKETILKESLIEIAFASYEYQKINNYYFKDFDKFFSKEKGSPFEFLNKIVISDKITDNGKSKERDKSILLNKNALDFDKYSLSLYKTLTHEFQHKISHYGTYKKSLFHRIILQDYCGIDEMCTEWNAETIICQFLDQTDLSVDKTKPSPNTQKEYTLKGKGKEKALTFNTFAKDYTTIVPFYETIDFILKGKLADFYYNPNEDLARFPLSYFNKYYKQIYKVSHTGYSKIFSGFASNYDNNIIAEKNYNNLTKAVTNLAESYVRNEIKVTKNTDLDDLSNYQKVRHLKEFFDTLSGANFKTDEKNPPYVEMIKQKVFKSIYKDEQKVNEALNVMDILQVILLLQKLKLLKLHLKKKTLFQKKFLIYLKKILLNVRKKQNKSVNNLKI